MKQVADKFTIDAYQKVGRGRQRNPNAKSSAQRQREFRQRQKFNFLNYVVRNEKSMESF